MYSRYFKPCLVLLTLLVLCSLCSCHGHAHEEPEPAHFKYSQKANEDINQDEIIDEHVEHKHGHSHDHVHTPKPKRSPVVADMNLWMKALGSTALVSIAPIFILILIPLDQSKERDSLLKVLLSFASGGLLGDAFLHLIPHALNPHTHGDEDDHAHSHGAHDHSAGLIVGLWVLAGIIAFLCVEKFVRIMKLGHTHSHSPAKKTDKKSESKTKSKVQGDSKKESSDDDDTKDTSTDIVATQEGDIQVAGYLNLVADFTHNFTDGLAIGVSYLLGENIGLLTTVTILFHEIPHEIGDFAILVQSGCSKKKAMLLQFTTAIGAMTGTFVSLALGGVGPEAMAWILPFTAGGFIYIATVSVIPELLKETSFIQSVKEIFALLVGVGMMVIIGVME